MKGMHMTNMTTQYTTAASHARNAVDKTADAWTEGARTVTDRLPGLPQLDLVPAVERYFDLVQRTVDINRRLAVRWAEAAASLSGAVREKAGSAGDVMREKAEAAGDIAREQAAKAEQAEKELARRARQAQREQAEKAERTAREQAAKAEQAEQELARQARQAQREHARQAHQRARQRYEGLSKAQLSDLLAKRDLPKTGNIDELIERLVEADSK
jgi:flagellar biosynthesis GTPase FlhF